MREYIDRQTLLARGIICEKDMIDKERRYWHKKAERYENTILRLAVLMAQGGDTDADN